MCWFQSTLSDGVSLSNAPDLPKTVFGRGILPFTEPLSVEPGDMLSFKLRGAVVQRRYVWQWHTTAHDSQRRVKQRFEQSSLNSEIIDPQKLRLRAPDNQPVLSEEGEVLRFALDQFAAGHTLQDVAVAIMRRFPQRIADFDKALALAGDAAVKYSA